MSELEELYRDSIDIFKKKGLELSRKIVHRESIIFVFHKYSLRTDNILEFGKDDFIISLGTSIYKGRAGDSALKELFEDFSNGNPFQDNLCGNYAVIISRKGQLFCFNDFFGLLKIYCDQSKTVLSTSFLAVSKTLKEKNVSSQELYEYLLHEAFYGGKTIYKEIELLDSDHIWQICPEIKKVKKCFNNPTPLEFKNVNVMLNAVGDNLIEFFNILKNIYGNGITFALTGGYDSRLMLALAKKVGISPHLYVYGEENSRDVKIAKAIAEGEDIAIEHINKNNYPKFAITDFYEILRKNFYCFDGLGIAGIFDNGSDFDTRIKRTRNSRIQLNGGGGGIYRNFLNIPDKSHSVKSFMKFKYETVDHAACTFQFNKKSYYSNFEEKIKTSLSIEGSRITRQQIEMAFPFLRVKYWISGNNTINNQFSYAITPYSEPRFVFQSFEIPIKYKNFGEFEAALIRKIDEEIAKYPSGYGRDFYHKNTMTKNNIEFVRRYIGKFTRPLRRLQPIKPPYFLEERYLREIFNLDDLAINQYINIKKIKNPDMLSRALSIENLIRNRDL